MNINTEINGKTYSAFTISPMMTLYFLQRAKNVVGSDNFDSVISKLKTSDSNDYAEIGISIFMLSNLENLGQLIDELVKKSKVMVSKGNEQGLDMGIKENEWFSTKEGKKDLISVIGWLATENFLEYMPEKK